jgi:hypothetical protein
MIPAINYDGLEISLISGIKIDNFPFIEHLSDLTAILMMRIPNKLAYQNCSCNLSTNIEDEKWNGKHNFLTLSLTLMLFANLFVLCYSDNVSAFAATPNPELDSSDSRKALAAKWGQWAWSIPAPRNPIVDETGVNCGANQQSNGRTWFLAGAFTTEPVDRTCTVPKGKLIYFPIIAVVATLDPSPEFNTIPELKKATDEFIDLVTSVDVTIDGVHLQGLDNNRVQSQAFRYFIPPNNIEGRSDLGPNIGVADGYWVILKPLPAGNHVIHFIADMEGDLFSQDVTYHITVK